MPNYNATESLYSSFDIGPVHFVAVSTEVYYYKDALERVKKQYAWLEQDLKVHFIVGFSYLVIFQIVCCLFIS